MIRALKRLVKSMTTSRKNREKYEENFEKLRKFLNFIHPEVSANNHILLNYNCIPQGISDKKENCPKSVLGGVCEPFTTCVPKLT